MQGRRRYFFLAAASCLHDLAAAAQCNGRHRIHQITLHLSMPREDKIISLKQGVNSVPTNVQLSDV